MRKLLAALILCLALTSPGIATVTDSTSTVQYTANGSNKAFPFTFGIGSTSEVAVTVTNLLGVAETLTPGTQYSVTCPNSNCSAGGTVTTVSTYPADYKITIVRDVPITQTSVFTEGMPTLFKSFERGLDKLTRIAQQHNEKLGRAILLPVDTLIRNATLPAPAAGYFLRWNNTATGLENAPGSAGGSYMGSGTGAVERSMNAKVGEIVSVKDFGAVGDGVADDSLAIELAAAYCNSVAAVYAPANYMYSPPILFFPSGKYRVTRTITMPGTAKIQGAKAIVIGEDAGADIFDFTGGYIVSITGLGLVGGKSHIVWSNTNYGAAELNIDDCEFGWSAGPALKFVPIAPAVQLSTELIVSRSRFMYNNSIYYGCLGMSTRFKGNQSIGANDLPTDVAMFENYGSLTLDDFQLSPTGETTPAGARLVDNWGQFRLVNSRIGGEGGGIPIVYQYAGPHTVTGPGDSVGYGGSVLIQNSTVLTGMTANENCLVKFVEGIPGLLIIEGSTWNYNDGTSLLKKADDFDIPTYLNGLNAFARIYIKIRNNEGMPPWPEITDVVFQDLMKYNTRAVYLDTDLKISPVTFADGATTPSVGNRKLFYTGNTSPTTISNFTDGRPGDEVTIIFGDNLTTIDFTGASFKGNDRDKTYVTWDMIKATFNGYYWNVSDTNHGAAEITETFAVSASSAGTWTLASLSGIVPTKAKRICGRLYTSAGGVTEIASNSSGYGYQVASAGAEISNHPYCLPLVTSQTLYWKAAGSSYIGVSSYEW